MESDPIKEKAEKGFRAPTEKSEPLFFGMRRLHISYPLKSIAATKFNAQRRVEALSVYLKAPILCGNCGSVIKPRPGKKLSSIKTRQYCSRRCATTVNNGKYPKRLPEGKCDECGRNCNSWKKYCSRPCKRAAHEKRRQKTTYKRTNGQYVVGWRKRAKAKAVDLLGGKCVICGYDKCVRSMHFHHLVPEQKEFSVSGRSYSWERILKELAKCILVCSNCHGEIEDNLIDVTRFLTSLKRKSNWLLTSAVLVRIQGQEPI